MNLNPNSVGWASLEKMVKHALISLVKSLKTASFGKFFFFFLL